MSARGQFFTSADSRWRDDMPLGSRAQDLLVPPDIVMRFLAVAVHTAQVTMVRLWRFL